MRKLTAALFLSSLFVLAACVTINVYFPSAAAAEAAEQFVEDVLAEPGGADSSYYRPGDGPAETLRRLAGGLLDLVVPSAQAQQAQIDIDTPQINAIKSRMAARHRSTLAGFYDAGAIGFTADGFVAIRDRGAVDLSARRNLESAVADENRDRKAVYREIALANGHPEWEGQIQETFAAQWVANARPGWYYQAPDGSWRQK